MAYSVECVQDRCGGGGSEMMAIALYDNEADADDELSFTRGQSLRVLSDECDGLDGWWKCSTLDRGMGCRIGLVPANRVRLVGEMTTSSENKVSDAVP
jgi:Variant SH3 domain